jgi:large subunit ribosomal protein L20
MRSNPSVARHKRRKKILKAAKGFNGARKNNLRIAKDGVMRARNYAFVGRKLKKRDFRALWIQRINAAARLNGMSYSKLMGLIHKADIELDRKALADLAVRDPAAFTSVLERARSAT